VEKYVTQLPESEQKKVVALSDSVAKMGPGRNTLKVNKLTRDLYEFKPNHLDRIMWFYDGETPDGRGHIVMTHAFKKEKNKTPSRELKRGGGALRVRYIQEREAAKNQQRREVSAKRYVH